MKTAIILHGMPEKEEYFDPASDSQSNAHWLPWLQRELLLNDVLAQTPELPAPYAPEYERWKAVFEQFPITEDTILVGHSCGAGFLARWLSEHEVKVGKVVLVAPWLDPAPRRLSTGFFDFAMDPNVPKRAASVTIFESDDDDEDIHASVRYLEASWPSAKIIELKKRGHFTMQDMGTREFPELLAELTA